jgi:tRNA(fMet)-specific endonuclease VapC
MDRALLDTDIFSEIIKGKNANVKRSASAYRLHFGRYTISTTTIAELVKGFAKRDRDDQINALHAALANEDVLTLDLDAAIVAGRMYGALEKSGQPIGRCDPLIAGIAIAHNLQLVTGNNRHFQRIVDLGFPLQLADWRTS